MEMSLKARKVFNFHHFRFFGELSMANVLYPRDPVCQQYGI